MTSPACRLESCQMQKRTAMTSFEDSGHPQSQPELAAERPELSLLNFLLLLHQLVSSQATPQPPSQPMRYTMGSQALASYQLHGSKSAVAKLAGAVGMSKNGPMTCRTCLNLWPRMVPRPPSIARPPMAQVQ